MGGILASCPLCKQRDSFNMWRLTPNISLCQLYAAIESFLSKGLQCTTDLNSKQPSNERRKIKTTKSPSDANQFLKKAEQELQPIEYKTLVALLVGFKRKEAPRSYLMEKVPKLLHQHPDLLLAFNEFLPAEDPSWFGAR
ncbi:expressed unknown protein [Seminavis robusta]|uniref:Uncharacterized protein n=1 Tax=Seminavis robusta TaxID=568900 RepID=A0A9N8H7L6_9STRA|nr:expressed unknown protein [Seminavis robusta]|eukprot:Sro208_g087060.1 n/a (140) ;mRNA; r:43921-44340